MMRLHIVNLQINNLARFVLVASVLCALATPSDEALVRREPQQDRGARKTPRHEALILPAAELFELSSNERLNPFSGADPTDSEAGTNESSNGTEDSIIQNSEAFSPFLIIVIVACSIVACVIGNSIYIKRRAEIQKPKKKKLVLMEKTSGQSSSGSKQKGKDLDFRLDKELLGQAKRKFIVLEKYSEPGEAAIYQLKGQSGTGNLAAWRATLGIPGLVEVDLTPEEDDSDEESDVMDLDTDCMPEDTYAHVIEVLVHDLWHVVQEGGSSHTILRQVRLLSSLGLLMSQICLQCMLLGYIMLFSCASAVQNIRENYDKYERHMYDNHVFLVHGGFARGKGSEFFVASNFETLDKDVADVACRIPLSQPMFLSLIILIWSIMVIGEFRVTTTMFERLIMRLPTIPSMVSSLKLRPDGGEYIVGLTIPVKVFIFCFMLLPRYAVSVVMLWLGSRWLLATADWENLVLNAVGLEFLLQINTLYYANLVPERSKRELMRCRIVVLDEGGEPTPMAYFGGFLWAILAVAWVVMYIFCTQGVLPFYQNDVTSVCDKHFISLDALASQM